jgi:hypothetical protein
MGANAQTTVPTFTASQVLTADQMNQSARTGVPVFATTTTRDAAFGGASEKTLAEGQLCYLESTNVVQYYDGAAWATVGPASAGAMVYLTGAAFSAQTTVAFANDTFTSTYDYYLVMLDAGADATFATLALQVRDNSGAKSTSDYLGGSSITIFSGTETNIGTNAQTSFPLQGTQSSENRTAWNIWVANPASATKKTKFWGTATADPTTGASIGGLHFGGFYNVAQAHTGLTFTFSNASTGLYRVYGLSNS